MRAAMRRGAAGRAADLLIVLRQLLAEEGATTRVGGPCARRRRVSVRLPGLPTLDATPARGVEAQVIAWRSSPDNRCESVV
ncbi:MAG: hypothetical protein CTY15_09500 [Methylocystis sp.]|nr:MAG: hypothetical protein CTY15_09500 [Methylocystis sp.]